MDAGDQVLAVEGVRVQLVLVADKGRVSCFFGQDLRLDLHPLVDSIGSVHPLPFR